MNRQVHRAPLLHTPATRSQRLRRKMRPSRPLLRGPADLGQDRRAGRVHDVLGLVEQRGDVVAALVEPGRLLRRRRGDQRAVRPVHVGQAPLERLAVGGAAPRRLGREVEVALADRLAVRVGPGFEELAVLPHWHRAIVPGAASKSVSRTQRCGRRHASPIRAQSKPRTVLAGGARPVRDVLPRRVERAASGDAAHPQRGRPRRAARPERAPLARRGRDGLPAAVAPAEPAGRRRRRPCRRSPARSPAASRDAAPYSSASPAASRSARARPPACCRRCWPAGPTTPASTSSPPTASCTRTPSSNARGLMRRKGFPESYDVRRLLRFLGRREVRRSRGVGAGVLPRHLRRPAGRGHRRPATRHPDRRGRQRAAGRRRRRRRSSRTSSTSRSTSTPRSTTSRQWYVDRFLTLYDTVFQQTAVVLPPLRRPRRRARRRPSAREIWHDINERNLTENIQPTRDRASLVLSKGPDHRVREVRLRRF